MPSTQLKQSTATVDNFVGNPTGALSEPRKYKASDGLLKL
jgi:hypothetical protein